MIDVVLPEKKLRVPIGFEEGGRTCAAGVDLVFVGINQARVRMLLDLERDKSERLLARQHHPDRAEHTIRR